MFSSLLVVGMGLFLWLFIAYLAGSIPFGYLVGRAKGLDVREHGSGNIGATNVWRVLGKGWGIFVFGMDFLKGFVPVFLFVQGGVTVHVPSEEWKMWLPVLTAVVVVLGHNYPCWLRFKGGKGIATSAGALLALFPVPLLIGLGVWALVFWMTRYVSVASMVGALVIPIVLWIFAYPFPEKIFGLFLCLLAIWRHRSNIHKLLNGTEHRFSK